MVFKVGQRVKNILDDSDLPCEDGEEGIFVPVGAEGVINEGPTIIAGRIAYGVNFDGYDDPDTDGVWCEACELAPLTDPKADAFLESIRNMKPYEEPVVQGDRITVTIKL